MQIIATRYHYVPLLLGSKWTVIKIPYSNLNSRYGPTPQIDDCACPEEYRGVGILAWRAGWIWVTWFLIIVLGPPLLTSLDAEFLNAAELIPIVVAYPIFLIGIRRIWSEHKLLATGGMVLHALYLLTFLAVFEASIAGLTEADLLTLFTLVISFGVPIFCARGQTAPARPKRDAIKVVVFRVISIIVAIIFAVVSIWAVSFGLWISATEFAQANAFRNFCEHNVEGSSIAKIRQLVPARFIRPRNQPDEFEISSHGRGCLVHNQEGTARLVQLLPRYGFYWMLAAPAGAGLQGTFEPGGVGKELLFPDLP